MKKYRLLAWLCLTAASLNSRLQAQEPEAASWKAGVARAIITPQKPVWLAGYGSKRVPEGKLHDIWLKALALEDSSGRRAVLVTSDFQGIPQEMCDRVCEQLKQQFGLERHQVMLTFSHNHCGPRLTGDLEDYYPIETEQVTLVDEYTRHMEQKIVATVGDSIAKLAPASLSIGEGTATFAVNRRNNRESDVQSLLASGKPLQGPVDHTVPVLAVHRPDGQLGAVLFGYACHPTTLSFTQWCGDYPGFAQIELERQHPGSTALFVNTCGGDQNPLPRREVELCERYGHALAAAVQRVLEQPLQPVSSGLDSAFNFVDLPYEKVATRDDLRGMLNDSNVIRARWAARMLRQLESGVRFDAVYKYPIHAWRLGNELLFIGMGGEAVVDYSLRFKREFGPGTWVLGYTDNLVAYIPSRRVWEEGGYEGGPNLYEYGRPALRWAGDVEDRIAASVSTLVRSVKAGDAAQSQSQFPKEFFEPPVEFADKFGPYRSPLEGVGNRSIKTPSVWKALRQQIVDKWFERLGPWPPLVERPEVKRLEAIKRDGYEQHHVHVQITPDGKWADGYLLVPHGPGPFPAVLVPFYEPLTSIGQGSKGQGTHDYGLQLVRRGFVTLSIGTPGSVEKPMLDTRQLLTEAGIEQQRQPLSYLAYVAANCHTALAQMQQVDAARIGIIGLSYGGKWSMFASCLYEKFACAVWSDPGIVFNEANANVNYWEPWYLGYEPNRQRKPGVPSADNPRTGLYKRMFEAGEDLVDLHALMAPRPVLVSGGTEDPPRNWEALNHLVAINTILGYKHRVALTSRTTHVPTPEALQLELQFLEYWLKPR
jgi:dienelactone hydrolase